MIYAGESFENGARYHMNLQENYPFNYHIICHNRIKNTKLAAHLASQQY